MTDDTLRLVYEGGGRFRVASTYDLESVELQFAAGEPVEVKPAKGRSLRQHRWFMQLVSEAFENQRGGPQFDNAERLRKWLLIKVGHCNEKRFAPRAMTADVAAWLRQQYDDMDFATDRVWIYARTAKSISFRACNSESMCEIADRVVDVICSEIVPGTTRETWQPYLAEGRQAAQRSAARKRKSVEGAHDTLHG